MEINPSASLRINGERGRTIKNLKKAAQRILKAIEKQERIIIYGDTDLDGVTAVIILYESIKSLGGNISAVYFPDRDLEGYGINETGLKFLKKYLKIKNGPKKNSKTKFKNYRLIHI